MVHTEKRLVIYHSEEWNSLVEQGWITETTDNRNGVEYATMLRQWENGKIISGK